MHRHQTSFFAFLFFLLLLATVAAPSLFAQDEGPTQEAIDLFQQGQDLHERGDLDGAMKLYDRSLTLLPDFPEAEVQRGNIFLLRKNYEAAETSFRNAVRLRGDWTLAKVSLGSLLVTTGKFDEARKLLDELIEDDPENSIAMAALADLQLRTDASEADRRRLLTSIGTFTDKARPTGSLLAAQAALELSLGDTASARLSVKRSLEVEPTRTDSLLLAAEIALRERDADLAETFLSRLHPSDASTDAALATRGAVLAAQARRDDAIQVLRQIAPRNQSAASLLRDLTEAAVDDPKVWEERVIREPTNVAAYSRLCELYRQKDPVKALSACRRASELEPNEISHAAGFGAALVQAREYDAAVGLLRKLLTGAPEHATIRANLATALFQLKRYPEAKLQFRWLTQNRPDSPAAFYFLAIVHDQLQEYLDAMANYQQFLKIADRDRDKLDIEKVNLRMPALQKLIKSGKGKRNGEGS